MLGGYRMEPSALLNWTCPLKTESSEAMEGFLFARCRAGTSGFVPSAPDFGRSSDGLLLAFCSSPEEWLLTVLFRFQA